MSETSAEFVLRHADRMANAAKRATRWYARYLLVFAVGTFVASVLVGVLAAPLGVVMGTALWVLLVAGLTAYSSRQKATVRRFGLLHGLVIGTWAALWGVTVALGTTVFGHQPVWWVVAGIACALPPLVGAGIVLNKTR